ncbi:DUF802 domain-containing protein [Curvibacter sp. HBC28]|uniref:DUF802 domain-containing protein n=1 Tax=Curvibacter microcysteis TaxID=3026419 RepID=A0ABT5MFB4_9BURK|nr:DUF802 domain-containing protein [Curvibacter sp. HBC28]MDD0815263.1 DUF802 domain-containing protein [Curvibacter sp. HBC28]
MNHRIVFAVLFAIGLLTLAWVGMGFWDSNSLALAVTALITLVYGLGALELHRYNQASQALGQGLKALSGEAGRPAPGLDDWLASLPAALRPALRQRIEGERVPLPGPALTPYLVGLLVMLGMLGTFLGMVMTFKGALFALEGSSDLLAIRSALAAPIKGLGLSFGTSVAGVASSALLGLLSALSRRERLAVLRQLDAQISTHFRPQSLAHQRQETLRVLQVQASALPAAVDGLQALMAQVQHSSEQLSQRLLAQQQAFHQQASTAYTELASSVGAALKNSLSESARLAGDSLKPVVEAAMAEVVASSRELHTRLGGIAQAQLDGMSQQLGQTAQQLAQGWSQALDQQQQQGDRVLGQLDQQLTRFTSGFEHSAERLLSGVQANATQAQAAWAESDQARLARWTQALQDQTAHWQADLQARDAQVQALHQATGLSLQDTAQALAQGLQDTVTQISAQSRTEAERTLAALQALSTQAEAQASQRRAAEAQWAQQQGAHLDQMAQLWRSEFSALRAEEAQRSQAGLAQWGEVQEAVSQQLQATVAQVSAQSRAEAERTLAALQQLSSEAEALASQRRAAEAQWAQQQGQHLDQMAQLWRSEFSALRAEEAQRHQAATAELGQLQQAVSTQLQATASQISQQSQAQAEQTLAALHTLLQQSEAFSQARSASEAQWAEQHRQHLGQMAELWRGELSSLRTDEAERGQAALERLGALEAAVAQHLSNLGQSLEAPMSRLMQTAAEVPQAASELLLQLREQVSQLSQRDQQALSERVALMERLGTLLQALEAHAGDHGQAVSALSTQALALLEQASARVADSLGLQAQRAEMLSADLSSSAIELASLGGAFQQGVQLFSNSNGQLIDALQRIEATLAQSSSRSDEQLAYYVAQAREVIDLSIAAQRGIVEDLRQLPARQASAEGSAG